MYQCFTIRFEDWVRVFELLLLLRPKYLYFGYRLNMQISISCAPQEWIAIFFRGVYRQFKWSTCMLNEQKSSWPGQFMHINCVCTPARLLLIRCCWVGQHKTPTKNGMIAHFIGRLSGIYCFFTMRSIYPKRYSMAKQLSPVWSGKNYHTAVTSWV